MAPDASTHDHGQEIAPGLSAPAYVEQPEDGERPVPLRHMPERTQDPDDWDVATTEPSDPRAPDDVVARRREAEEDARLGSGADRDDALAVEDEDESAYSTEIEQGAAPPRDGDADGTEFQQDSDG